VHAGQRVERHAQRPDVAVVGPEDDGRQIVAHLEASTTQVR
jgi:hypothetical protein